MQPLSLSFSASLSLKRKNAVARPRCYMILMFKTIQTELLFLYLHIIIMCVLRSLQRKWNWWWCCQRRISFRRMGKSKREFWPKIFSFSYDLHLTERRDLNFYTLKLLYVWKMTFLPKFVITSSILDGMNLSQLFNKDFIMKYKVYITLSKHTDL